MSCASKKEVSGSLGSREVKITLKHYLGIYIL